MGKRQGKRLTMGFFCKCGKKFDDKKQYYLRFEEVCLSCIRIAIKERIRILQYEDALKETPKGKGNE